MGFSLLSWNVEEFDSDAARLSKVTDHIGALNPDVFGLFEVEDVDILDLMRNELPDYDYSLTDGPQSKEILAGVRRQKFDQVVFSQKREFKVYRPGLRPGVLITLYAGAEVYNVLLLHTDSGTEPSDFGNRYEMYQKIWSLKQAIDALAQASSVGGKFIVLGDLNTMGMLFPYKRISDRRVAQDEEIQALEEYGSRRGMVLLAKEYDTTFSDGRIVSDLDHVLATDNINFGVLGQRNGEPFHVRVTGWQQLQGQARLDFIRSVSDHCSLYCEIL